MPGSPQDMLWSGSRNQPHRQGVPHNENQCTSDQRRGGGQLSEAPPHHVVIVGGGFGGLAVAQGLAGVHAPGVRITLIDQRNHHLFQPLLYQVGTAVLATSEIAWPIRHLLRERKEVTTLLAVVVGVDAAK